jgi:hypothetical protein
MRWEVRYTACRVRLSIDPMPKRQLHGGRGDPRRQLQWRQLSVAADEGLCAIRVRYQRVQLELQLRYRLRRQRLLRSGRVFAEGIEWRNVQRR